MTPKAFVLTELQIALPFSDVPWQRINETLLQQPGLLNKTWLSGVGNQSVGGFYAFDSIEHATRFCTDYFPQEARALGAAQTTRIFDAHGTEEASRDMNSVYFGGTLTHPPGAFVYTEVWLNASPFSDAIPWRTMNPTLKQQRGLTAKTWLSGLHTGTAGGLYAFDTIAHASAFALEYFPTEAASLNAAFQTRVFNGAVVAEASQPMRSPFYA